MLRFNIILVGLVIGATGASAHSGFVLKRPVPQTRISSSHTLLDLAHLRLFRLFHRSEGNGAQAAEPASDHANDWSRQTSLPDLSMGPLHPTFGQDDNPLADLPAFETQDQLGSSVWKDMQNKSNSAKLLFIWPTDK